jgi:hypothetical protein
MPVIPILVGVAKAGAIMTGIGFLAEGAQRVTKRVAPPVIAGVVEPIAELAKMVGDPFNFSNTPRTGELSIPFVGKGEGGSFEMPVWADPIDLFGTRRAADKKRDQDASRTSAVSEAEKRKATEKSTRAAKAKADTATKRAKQATVQADKLNRQGKTEEAGRLQREAMAQERWAEFARKSADSAQKLAQENIDKAFALSQMSLDFAQNAMKPPATAADSLVETMTDEGKALYTSFVDAVNRFVGPKDESPEYDEYLEAFESGDIEGIVAGISSRKVAGGERTPVAGCCSSCSAGMGSCSKGIADVMIDGPASHFSDGDGIFVQGAAGVGGIFDDDDDEVYDLIGEDEEDEDEIFD